MNRISRLIVLFFSFIILVMSQTQVLGDNLQVKEQQRYSYGKGYITEAVGACSTSMPGHIAIAFTAYRAVAEEKGGFGIVQLDISGKEAPKLLFWQDVPANNSLPVNRSIVGIVEMNGNFVLIGGIGEPNISAILVNPAGKIIAKEIIYNGASYFVIRKVIAVDGRHCAVIGSESGIGVIVLLDEHLKLVWKERWQVDGKTATLADGYYRPKDASFIITGDTGTYTKFGIPNTNDSVKCISAHIPLEGGKITIDQEFEGHNPQLAIVRNDTYVVRRMGMDSRAIAIAPINKSKDSTEIQYPLSEDTYPIFTPFRIISEQGDNIILAQAEKKGNISLYACSTSNRQIVHNALGFRMMPPQGVIGATENKFSFILTSKPVIDEKNNHPQLDEIEIPIVLENVQLENKPSL